MLQGKKIILGITGSISAYKSAILTRLFIKAGAEVQVLMTHSAKEFVGTLTFSTLSKKTVITDIHSDLDWNNHVALGMWADLMVVAPASANTISKMANGQVDNILTAVYLSCKCPVMIAPAMDLDMWQHPSTQFNISRLQTFGNQIIPVSDGPLASGLTGPGRLAEPEIIFEEVKKFIGTQHLLSGKRILITAGPTFEAIDPVRYIGNHSSGKMGIRIAERALFMGAKVELILGPTQEDIHPQANLQVHRIVTAHELFTKTKELYTNMHAFILAAAVADFRPEASAPEKIKKENKEELLIRCLPTEDTAAFLGQNKSNDQILCGFALETEEILPNAKKKLQKKNMDFVVINSPKIPGSGFGHETNQIQLLDRTGHLRSFELKLKKDVAEDILLTIFDLYKL